jgi:hypothetical protein
MLAAYSRCGLTKAKQHLFFTFSSVYIPNTRLIKTSFLKAAPKIFLVCFPYDISYVNVTPRHVTSSDALIFIPLTVYVLC